MLHTQRRRAIRFLNISGNKGGGTTMCQLLASIFNGKRQSCTDSAQPLAGSVIPSGERVSCLFARVEALRITMLFAAARRLCALLRLLRLLDRRTGKAGVIGGSCASAAGGRRWRVVMQCASALLRRGTKVVRDVTVAGRGVVLRCVVGKWRICVSFAETHYVVDG